MAFEHYIYAGLTRLRCGYTTGSCAALAAKAACQMAFGEGAPRRVSITVPAGLAVEVDVLEPSFGSGWGRCAVKKDAGDDVDATDGLLVFAEVRLLDDAAQVAASSDGSLRISIDGGEGVGRVTLPGLEQPVGAAAINATPRKMIADAVAGVCAAHGYAGRAEVVVSVPGGEEVAAKTFNPHLGIEGGISILGTTGIVEPRSLTALRDCVLVEIRQHAALGARGLVLTPGNYGEQYIADRFRLDGVPVVVMSNFIGDALDCAAQEGFESVLVVGHIGKLVKVAAGVMNTHSRTADCRAETLAAHAAMAGAASDVVRAIMEAPTTAAALDLVSECGAEGAVRRSLAIAIQDRLERRVAGAYPVGAVVFDNAREELFRTSGAGAVIAALGARYE